MPRRNGSAVACASTATFGLMVAFAGIVSNGIFDRYPNVRLGFLEGGVGWLLTCIERFDAACASFQQFDPDRRFFQLRGNEGMRDYLQRHIEVTNSTCKEEIEDLLDNPDLGPADKEAILHGNAERLYGLQPARPATSTQSEETCVRTPA